MNNRINNIRSWLSARAGFSARSGLLPSTCLSCGQRGMDHMDLCRPCREELPWIEHPCRSCALPLAPTAESGLCGQCLKNPPVVQRIIAPFAYDAPIREWLLSLKYQGKLDRARLLGDLLYQHLQQHPPRPLPQLLLPVPLHPLRQRQRGFNQALELARPLARQLHIPLRSRLCQRIRPTQPQAELKIAQRGNNVKGAFRLRHPAGVQHVAIIDDIITTGNTINEIARLLRAQGVERIEAWSVARATL